jgi:putative phage-type endonuclease
MNPYRTNVELWELKTGRRQPEDLSGNPFVEYGSRAEEHLRELFKLDFPEYEVGYEENNIWLNGEYPWAHGSLDGWLRDPEGRFGVLEIKTTNILQSMQREKWRDRIPDNYYIQVLHYMMVLEADFAILKAQLRFDYAGDIRLTTRHYRIDRADVLEDLEYLEKAERQFSEFVKMDKKPPLILPVI